MAFETAATQHVNKNVRRDIWSMYVQQRILLYVLLGQSEVNGSLFLTAQPDPMANFKSGVSLGGASMMQTMRQQRIQAGGLDVGIRYQLAKPDTKRSLAPDGTAAAAAATASKRGNKLFGTLKHKWAFTYLPLEFDTYIENAQQGGYGIGNIVEETYNAGRTQFFEDLGTELVAGTVTQNDQDLDEYPNLMGLRHQISNGQDNTGDGGLDETAYRYFAGADRNTAANEPIKGFSLPAPKLVTDGYVSAATVSLEMIRQINTNLAIGGFQNRAADGGKLVMVSSKNFNRLRNEVLDTQQIYAPHDKIPEIGLPTGFSKHIINVDGTLITYDPTVAGTEMFILTPSSWLYEVAPGFNFRLTKWVDQFEEFVDGGRQKSAKLALQHRLVCMAPYLNAKVTNLTH